jgi:hypothetical protein
LVVLLLEDAVGDFRAVVGCVESANVWALVRRNEKVARFQGGSEVVDPSRSERKEKNSKRRNHSTPLAKALSRRVRVRGPEAVTNGAVVGVNEAAVTNDGGRRRVVMMESCFVDVAGGAN